jgi:hypothetical protein
VWPPDVALANEDKCTLHRVISASTLVVLDLQWSLVAIEKNLPTNLPSLLFGFVYKPGGFGMRRRQ